MERPVLQGGEERIEEKRGRCAVRKCSMTSDRFSGPAPSRTPLLELERMEEGSISFEPSQLVLKYRKRLPLSELQKSLSSYEREAEDSFCQIVTSSVENFIGLTKEVGELEPKCERLRARIEDEALREKVENFAEKVGMVQERLSRLLEEQKLLSLIRTLTLLKMNFLELRERVQAMRAEKGKGNPEEASGLFAEFSKKRVTCTALEAMQVAEELTRLERNIDRKVDKESKEFQSLISDLLELKSDFLLTIEQQLERNLHLSSREAGGTEVVKFLKVFQVLNSKQKIEFFCSEKVFSPFLDVLFEGMELGRERLDLKKLLDKLNFFSEVDEFNSSETDSFLDSFKLCKSILVASRNEGLFLERSFLKYFCQSLVDRTPEIFMPTYPDLFAQNYWYFRNFSTSLLPEHPEVACELQGGWWAAFWGKWKVQVLLSMRRREVDEDLLSAAKWLSSQEGEGSDDQTREGVWSKRKDRLEGNADGFLSLVNGSLPELEMTESLLRGLFYIWSDKVALPPLLPRLLRCSSEFIEFYRKVLEKWTEAYSLKKFKCVLRDLKKVELACEKLTEIGVKFLEKCAADSVPRDNAEKRMSSLFDMIRVNVRESREDLRKKLIGAVSEDVCRHLSGISQMVSLYRMTSKPLTEKASAYIDQALFTLGSLKDPEEGGDDCQDEAVREVGRNVVEFFTRKITELLGREKKLQKHMESEDFSKILVAVRHDANCLRRGLEGFGLDVELADLMQAVEL